MARGSSGVVDVERDAQLFPMPSVPEASRLWLEEKRGEPEAGWEKLEEERGEPGGDFIFGGWSLALTVIPTPGNPFGFLEVWAASSGVACRRVEAHPYCVLAGGVDPGVLRGQMEADQFCVLGGAAESL